MKLSDYPQLREQIRDELANWGRWASDEWLRHNLMPKSAAIFRHYQPEAGDVFGAPHRADPVDELAAQATEDLIILMGLVAFDEHRALIARYPHRHSWEIMQQRFGWSVAQARRLVLDGEQLYADMKRGA